MGAALGDDNDNNDDDVMVAHHNKKKESGAARDDDLALVDLFRKHQPSPSPYPCFTEQEQAIFPERAPKPRRQKFRTVIAGELLPIYDAK